ncbi:hypothetical protein, partial [Kitasatospora putterlickiae]|uniref:hypothetical protein n=1 Tax=Kitasatospora putterlickiae TaxID=221725 RepID=UPI0031D77AF9
MAVRRVSLPAAGGPEVADPQGHFGGGGRYRRRTRPAVAGAYGLPDRPPSPPRGITVIRAAKPAAALAALALTVLTASAASAAPA